MLPVDLRIEDIGVSQIRYKLANWVVFKLKQWKSGIQTDQQETSRWPRYQKIYIIKQVIFHLEKLKIFFKNGKSPISTLYEDRTGFIFI